jgi:hypothetical protein
MKTRIFTLLIVSIFLLPPILAAKGPGGGGNSRVNESGLATLDQFLDMGDDELEQLEATIRRIRQMTPEERQAYREKISRYRKMDPQERQSIQQAWGQLDARVRTAWREFMLGLSPDEREAVRDEMQATPPEQRTQFRISLLEEKGLLP